MHFATNRTTRESQHLHCGLPQTLIQRAALLAVALVTLTTVALVGPGVSSAAEPILSTELRSTYDWQGPAANVRLGDHMEAAGDVNGDGIQDYVVNGNGANYRGGWVLFGPYRNAASVNLDDLHPSRGYRMRTPSGNPLRVLAVGDQDGDGVPDFVIHGGSAVIYGVPDPAADLPKCDPLATEETRCVEVSDPRDIEGERLGYRLTTPGVADWRGADLTGDSKNELVVPTSEGLVILTHGIGGTCDDDAPGVCTIDPSDLDGDQVTFINRPVPTVTFGNTVSVVGDINGDGKQDLLTTNTTDADTPPGVWVIYGDSWVEKEINVASMGSDQAYRIETPSAAIAMGTAPAGDFNGDGIPDIAVWTFFVIPSVKATWSIIYGTREAPSTQPGVNPPAEGKGVQYTWDASLGNPAGTLVPAGDLNGDGFDDVVILDGAATVDGNASAGQATVLFGGALDSNQVEIDGDTPNGVALRLAGSSTNERFAARLVSPGDLDQDGIPDFAISSAGASNSGKLSLVPGSELFGSAVTGVAAGLTTATATLSGTARANGRQSSAYFEYGLTDEYGAETPLSDIGAGKALKPVEAGISSLASDATYHYRLVVENDLGLKSFGPDRTFTTVKDSNGGPGEDPCETNQAAAGCPGFCAANPNAVGCHKEPAPTARLSNLIAVSNAQNVRRGRGAQVRAWVTNTGNGNARGVRICLNVPKRLIAGNQRRCQGIGNVVAGRTVRAQFRIKVRPRARRGARPTLRFTASGQGLVNRTAQVRFRVR